MDNGPSREEAERLLAEGALRNPGGWVDHSRYVARAAAAIAAAHPALDEETAYVMGLLHDIGRQEGVTGIRHIVDGYEFMQSLGYGAIARICLTHSFPVRDHRAASSGWEVCTPAQTEFVAAYLQSIEYDEYDRLLQLCDALALSSGFTLLEKRMLDVVYRYGPNAFTVAKWQATFALRDHFATVVGDSIYRLLPGVVANTFGFDPCA